MPGLTQDDIRELKARLTARREELRGEIHAELMQSGEASYVELAGRVRDAGDESVADMLSDVGIAVLGRQMEEIQDIEAALARIAERSYGVCIDCGGDIAKARLLAYPTAKRCIDCQTRHDKTFAGKHTSTL